MFVEFRGIYAIKACILTIAVLSSVFLVNAQPSQEEQIVRVETNSAVVIFRVDGFTYHAVDPSTGNPSEDAFVLDFNGFKEVSPNGTVVQLTPDEIGIYNVTLAESLKPPNNSDLIYESAYRVDIRNIVGTSITFWVFTENQIVYDVYTNRSIEVSEGSMKYSLFLPFWPFLNEDNFLQVSTNITTLIPETLSKCYIPPTDPDITAITCEAETLTATLQLVNKGVTFGFYDTEPTPLRTQIDLFVCPLEETPETRRIGEMTTSGSFCDINIVETIVFPFDGSLPQSSDYDDDNDNE